MKKEINDKKSLSDLDKKLKECVIGQDEAKRAVAIALRNRYRRAMLPDDIRDEVTPKNIRLRKTILNTANRLKAQARNKQ